MGVKATAGDSTALLPPARVFDTLTGDAVGGRLLSLRASTASSRESVAFTAGADPALNHPPQPADRNEEVAVATFNVENLYDFRDDPFDGCDFTGNTGCPGVSPPFDYVPAQRGRLPGAARPSWPARSSTTCTAPDIILVQEAEDQDICTVVRRRAGLRHHQQRRRQAGHPAGAGAGDRGRRWARSTTRPTTATAPTPAASSRRSCTARTGCRWPPRRRPTRCSVGPTVQYRSARRWPYNADVQNPKALNAVLPADVDTLDRRGRVQRVHPGAAGGASSSWPRRPARPRPTTLWAISNHYSSGPDARVGQRTEQAGVRRRDRHRDRGGRPERPGRRTAAT